MRNNFILAIIWGSVLALLVSACSTGQAVQQVTITPTVAKPPTSSASPATPKADANASQVIKVGDNPAASNAGYYIALERGYFKEEGLNVELVKFSTAADMIPALATGQLDVAAGGISVGLFNAAARGTGIKIVADKGSALKGFGWQAFLVKKDVYDSGKIRSIKDLKGKKVAMSGAGIVTETDLEKALEQAGLKYEDVEVAVVPFPDQILALANGSIDVAINNEPYTAIALEQGTVASIGRIDEFYPNHQVSVILYSDGFALRQTDLGKRWMAAYLRGVRDYNDAFVKGKGKEDIFKIIAKYTGAKDTSAYEKMTPTGLNPDGYVNKESLDWDQKFWVQRNSLQSAQDVNKLVDNQFVDYAIQKLGKYSK